MAAAKDTKTALKAAREAIRKKEYKEALKHCKGILKHDKQNYNALVFIGVAAEGLDQPDQAIMAYKKATEADPAQALAWQGLCGFYEKANKPEYSKDLLEAYSKLSELLSSDIARRLEILIKLALLHVKLEDTNQAVAVLMEAHEAVKDDEVKSVQVGQHLVSILGKQPSLSTEENQVLMKSYKTVLHASEASRSDRQMWKEYLNCLLKASVSREDLQSDCLLMSERYPDEVFTYNILCQMDLDRFIETSDVSLLDKLKPRCEEIAKLDRSSIYPSLLEACTLISNNAYKQAEELLTKSCKVERQLVSIWFLLAECHLHIHNYSAAKSTAARALKLLDDGQGKWSGNKDIIGDHIKLMQGKASVEIGTDKDLSTSIEILEEMRTSSKDEEVSLWLGYAYLAQGDLEKTSQIISEMENAGSHSTQKLKGWYYFKKGDLRAAEGCLTAIENKTGRIMYQLGHVQGSLAVDQPAYLEKSFGSLLQAAKLDPYYSPTFYDLGRYYETHVKDRIRARRCYQKCYDLDPGNSQAGSSLVDILSAEGEEAAAIHILKGVTQKASAGSAKWAWLRLGLNQMTMGEHTNAIMSLQSALRADPKDGHAWECLGEAYLNRGSYTAALKAFTRATELNEDATYCFYQIATIQQVLGNYTEAISQFDVILTKSPDYVPALKGAGESHLLLAKAALTKFFHGRAVDHCQQAIYLLTRAAVQRSDMSCIWKLIGDACTILHPVDEEKVRLNVPVRLLTSQKQSEETASINKRELMALGGRCYGMALKQMPDCASLWHDLGVNYLLQAKTMADFDAKSLIAKATQSLQKAVIQDPTNYRHWLALGIIATSELVDNPALAQHCFIKSIKAEQNNVSAWTFLGALYLKAGQVEHAHEAFKVAQSLEPSYVGCWVGQAVIAETVGHDEAMDLFRHTTELASHTEGALGYASWVIATMANKAKLDPELYKYTITQMSAVPSASDVLARYTDRRKTNPLAYNLHGLLLEKQGLYQQAKTAFKSAVDLLIDGDKNQLRLARSNYARILCVAGNYEESITMYKTCGTPYTFEEECGLALAFYKSNMYTESIQTYESALKMASREEDKAHVQAALGLVTFKAGDTEGAKTLLFKCSQMERPSVEGLKALCSLGLEERNPTLAGAVLQEINKLGHLEDHSADILYLTAELMAAQGPPSIGLSYLQRELHARPHLAPYWKILAQYLLKRSPGASQIAATCGQAAQKLQACSDRELSNTQSIAALAGGLHSRQQSHNNAFSFVQKAVHLHPAMVSQWCSLLGAIHAEQVVRAALNKGKGLERTALALAAHLMAKVESELSQGEGDRQELAALHLWTVKQYIVTLLSLGRKSQAQQFLQQAIWLYDNDPVLKSLSASLDQNFRGMRTSLNDHHSPFLWQLLIEGLKGQGLFNEVEKVLKQWLQSSGLRPAKLVPLVQLTHLAYTRILAGGKENKWRMLLNEASSEALLIDPQCSAVHLMSGIIQLHDENNRQAKYSFHQALGGSRTGDLPVARSASRQQLLKYYMTKKDEEKIKVLLCEAELEKDEDFLKAYEKVIGLPGQE